MPKKCAVGGSNGIKGAMDKMEPTDRELVAAVRSGGPPDRIGDLFIRHLGRVRNLMYQMTFNHADADDLTQEVFLRAARGLPDFDGRAEFATWLHRIALNCANRFLVRRARRATASLEEAPEPVASGVERPDRQAAGAETDARIRQALERLPVKLRAAIVLTVLQDVALPEAARIERCAVPTMYWRVHEARRQLKELLVDMLP